MKCDLCGAKLRNDKAFQYDGVAESQLCKSCFEKINGEEISLQPEEVKSIEPAAEDMEVAEAAANNEKVAIPDESRATKDTPLLIPTSSAVHKQQPAETRKRMLGIIVFVIAILFMGTLSLKPVALIGVALYIYSPFILSILLIGLGGYLIWKSEADKIHGTAVLITGISSIYVCLFFLEKLKHDSWGFGWLVFPFGWGIITAVLLCIIWPVSIIIAALRKRITYSWLWIAVPLLAASCSFSFTVLHERYEAERLASGVVTPDDLKSLLAKYRETVQDKPNRSVFDKISKLIANKNVTPEMQAAIVDNIPAFAATVANQPNLTPVVSERIFTLNDLPADRAMAENPYLPADMFRKLRGRGDHQTIEKLAQNEAAPFYVLESIYWKEEVSFGARIRIASHPQATQRVADDFVRKTFASGTSDEKREATEKVRNCSQKILVNLAGSEPTLKEALDSNLAYRQARRELAEVARLKALLPTLLKGQRPLRESGVRPAEEVPFQTLTRYGVSLQYPENWEVTPDCLYNPRADLNNPHLCLRPKGWLASEQVRHFGAAKYPFILAVTNEPFEELANAYSFKKKGGQWVWTYGTYEHPASTVRGDNWTGVVKESEEAFSFDKERFASNEAKAQNVTGTKYKREVVIDAADKLSLLITSQDMDVNIFKTMLNSIHIAK